MEDFNELFNSFNKSRISINQNIGDAAKGLVNIPYNAGRDFGKSIGIKPLLNEQEFTKTFGKIPKFPSANEIPSAVASGLRGIGDLGMKALIPGYSTLQLAAQPFTNKPSNPTTTSKPKPNSTPVSASRSKNLEDAQQMSTMGNSTRRSETDDLIGNARQLSMLDRENRDYNSNRDIDFTKRNLTEISPMVSGILSDRQRTSLANEFPYRMYDTQSQMQDNAYQTTSNNNTRKMSDLLASAKGRYY